MLANEVYNQAKSVTVTNGQFDAVTAAIKQKAAQGLTCYEVDEQLSEETIETLRRSGFQVVLKQFNDDGKGRSWAHTYINADRTNEWQTSGDAVNDCKNYNHRISLFACKPPTVPQRTVAPFIREKAA